MHSLPGNHPVSPYLCDFVQAAAKEQSTIQNVPWPMTNAAILPRFATHVATHVLMIMCDVDRVISSSQHSTQVRQGNLQMSAHNPGITFGWGLVTSTQLDAYRGVGPQTRQVHLMKLINSHRFTGNLLEMYI